MTITIVMLGKLFVLFSYGKFRDILLGIRIKFHLGRAKGRGKREYEGRSQK